jgi:hypothetical protein
MLHNNTKPSSKLREEHRFCMNMAAPTLREQKENSKIADLSFILCKSFSMKSPAPQKDGFIFNLL